ncbi:MAG TPA: nucleotide exchange factor GrpE [Terriglobales bacterium]|jgi:molecular chaperone GrpE|nr:nucleotide exchange factor GrpE [Terriglobales bacterium]
MNSGSSKGTPKDQVLDMEHEFPAASGENPPSGPAAEPTELERLKSERDSLLDRAARLQAEFDNYRKRQAREQQEFREYALADALKSLLPILDSFERAIVTPGTGEEFRSGVELINRQLHDTLARLGIQPIRAEGASFDPNLHQAIQMVETADANDNHVLEELQRGYKLKDRLLRPAMVRVARNPGK